MLPYVRKLFILAALASWGLVVLGLIRTLPVLWDGHSGVFRRMIVYGMPTTLFFHCAAALLVLGSDRAYARAWTLALVASGLGQVCALLVFLSLAERLAEQGFPVF